MQNSKMGMDYRDFTLEQLQDLGKKSAEGDMNAREQLIVSHLGLVYIIMQDYSGRGTDNDDLFQEGCYGLILAVDNYDYRRGTRLSTYAVHWIRKRMQIAVTQQNINNPISMAPDLLRQLCKYKQCYTQLQESLKCSPSTDELSKATGFSEDRIKYLQNLLFSFTSLDAPQCGYSGSAPRTRRLTFTEQNAPSAEDEVIAHLAGMDPKETDLPIKNIPLTRRERDTLKRHLGFTPYGFPEPYTMISAETGLSRESIRRDFYEAIRKLREGLAQNTEETHSREEAENEKPS